MVDKATLEQFKARLWVDYGIQPKDGWLEGAIAMAYHTEPELDLAGQVFRIANAWQRRGE